MKARKSRSELSRSFSQLLNRRLVSYATAATAAGAGLLGVAQPAEAQIVYTPTHVVIGPRVDYMLDLTNDGTTDFVIHRLVTANCSTVFSRMMIKPAPQNAMEGATHLGTSTANALRAGERIGSSQRFVNGGNAGALMGEAINSPGGGQYRGQWVNVFNRYLGLKFQINGETHFGWARMSMKFSFFQKSESVLNGYAYETQPNTPITAGQQHGEADGVRIERDVQAEPGPRSSLIAPRAAQPAWLGALALGAAGLALWRPEQAVHS